MKVVRLRFILGHKTYKQIMKDINDTICSVAEKYQRKGVLYTTSCKVFGPYKKRGAKREIVELWYLACFPSTLGDAGGLDERTANLTPVTEEICI